MHGWMEERLVGITRVSDMGVESVLEIGVDSVSERVLKVYRNWGSKVYG